MHLPQGTTWSRHLVFYALALFHLASTVRAKNECQPIYWEPGQFEKRTLANTTSTLLSSFTGSVSVSSSLAATSTAVTAVPVTISPLISSGYVTPGQVNCRYAASTADMEINYYTCTALAHKYGIPVETFFMLNQCILTAGTLKPIPSIAWQAVRHPHILDECFFLSRWIDNRLMTTTRCIVIEPLRAYDGLCGPPNNNATCLGTKFGQCCNANTFKCGNSP